MTDNNAHARSVLDETCYAVLATADADGNPWATPVWFANDGLDRLYWLSWPGSVPNAGTAFYASARAGQCTDEQLDHGLRILNRRSQAQGIGEFTRERTTGQSRLRLYVAEITEAWVLDQDADVDQRAPVPP